jgi:hypothetical protein
MVDGRWSMVRWSTGARMVAVDVAIAHREPRAASSTALDASQRGVVDEPDHK